MSSDIPRLLQDSGVPFDMFIQSLTEQLDKAQAAMALKARVGKLPLTFAVKDISLDLRAFVQLLEDEIYIRPAGPGDSEASTIKLGLTTITKSMVEENAMDFEVEDPKLSLGDALGKSKESEDLQRRLEKIGVRNIKQLADLRKTAGTDVIARLARFPHNRLQQLLKIADLPRVTLEPRRTIEPQRAMEPRTTREPQVAIDPRTVKNPGAPIEPGIPMEPGMPMGPRMPIEPRMPMEPGVAINPRVARIPRMAKEPGMPDSIGKQNIPNRTPAPNRFRLRTPLINQNKLLRVLAGDREVPIVELKEGEMVLEPLVSQLGSDATLELGNGESLKIQLVDGYVGSESKEHSEDLSKNIPGGQT